MSIEQITLRLPASRIGRENPLPMFRDGANRPVGAQGLSEAEREGLSRATGRRVLPYRMQDQYDAASSPMDVKAIALQNEHLRAVFLPEWGGRLYSLVDLDEKRELLFSNPAIRLGNLALRDAWFAGGIEWNFGHFGHTFLTCAPMFFAACRDAEGNAFLRMYEYERAQRMTFQIDFHLPPGARHLTAHMRVHNPREAGPIFLWTNTAVTQRPGARAFSGTDDVLLLVEPPAPKVPYFVSTRLPDPLHEGIDHSIPANVPHAEEYFFQNAHDTAHAFESFLYTDGSLFCERSTGNYPYRKIFCWGNHSGGATWQQRLTGGDTYLEVQAGLYRTQQHALDMAAGDTLCVTQMFGGARVDAKAFQGAYSEARARMERAMLDLIPPKLVEEAHARSTALGCMPAESLLHSGSGWGALERARERDFLPAHLDFPDASLTSAQKPWLALLSGARFEGAEEFMTAPEWIPLMRAALDAPRENAALATHLGVALYEMGAHAEAEALWKQAAGADALRNLAFACRARGDMEGAAQHLERALALLGEPDLSYAQEYLAALNDAGQDAHAYAYYLKLSPALQSDERMRLLALSGAYAAHDERYLDAQFAHEFTVVREGDTRVYDLWLRTQARRMANGTEPDGAALERARAAFVPPAHLDFRMKT